MCDFSQICSALKVQVLPSAERVNGSLSDTFTVKTYKTKGGTLALVQWPEISFLSGNGKRLKYWSIEFRPQL